VVGCRAGAAADPAPARRCTAWTCPITPPEYARSAGGPRPDQHAARFQWRALVGVGRRLPSAGNVRGTGDGWPVRAQPDRRTLPWQRAGYASAANRSLMLAT
jgi:hypothetical protein